MIDYAALGAGLRYYRKRKNMTQEVLSEQVNVGDKFLSRIEGGKAKPSLELLINLCNVLKVGIVDCFTCDLDNTALLEKRLSSQLKNFTEIDKQFLCQVASSLENFRESGVVSLDKTEKEGYNKSK